MSFIPPFKGFPRESLDFLRRLEENNNREWFDEYKEDYLEYLVSPMVSYVNDLGQKLQTLDKDIVYDTRTNGQGSMLRIYRDTRFSKDKPPYHTYHRVSFWHGPGKRMARPGYFLWFNHEGWGLHGGCHVMDKRRLQSYRDAVMDNRRGLALERALTNLEKAGDYEVGEPEYKRVPRGYDADRPRADLLRHKGVHASSEQDDVSVIQRPAFVDESFRLCQGMAPLVGWLNELKGWE